MGVNLTDWLGDHLWALWLSLGFLLLIAELLSLDLILVMLAVGAFAAAGTAAIAPDLWWLQVLVGIGVSAGTLAVLRPTLIRKVRDAPGYRSSTAKLVGSSGRAVAEITAAGGEVKIDGQTWTARTMEPDTVIESGTEIEVFEIDGAIAVVYPKYGRLG